MTRDRGAFVLLGIAAACVVFVAFAVGYGYGRGRTTSEVCHSVVEDEAPYDCDYVTGGWYPR